MKQTATIATSVGILCLLCALPGAGAQAEVAGGPFSRLEGQWTGEGSIKLSKGPQERIRCRASYDVLSAEKMQLNIRCASDSYNFDLRGSADYSGGEITGTWSEATRNTGGRLSGTATDDRIQVVADSPGFSANLALTTRGDRQSVVIQSRKPDSDISGATIKLRR